MKASGAITQQSALDQPGRAVQQKAERGEADEGGQKLGRAQTIACLQQTPGQTLDRARAGHELGHHGADHRLSGGDAEAFEREG